MKAILLCPGPSLSRYEPQPADPSLSRYEPQPADIIAGVNRAAVAFAVDAWIALDPPLVRKTADAVIGSPVLVTSSDTPPILARQGWHWRGEVVGHRDLAACVPQDRPTNYCLYSATAALVYLAWRGATSIDVYGADWEGYLDFDGIAGGANRTPQRWENEVRLWTETAGELQRRGVVVTRIHL